MKQSHSSEPDILRFPHPVLASGKLRGRPRQITLMNKKYVLFRDKAGRPVALPDACPHRGAQLSQGKRNAEGELVCAYHAWRINSNGNATCPSVARRSCKLPLLKTWERYGFIWIANANVPEESFPDFINPEYELIGGFSDPFKAPLPVVLDNFSEVEHAFQVHTFIGPSQKLLDSVDFSVDIQEEKTYGFMSCRYRGLPLYLHRFFGIRKNDLYHNDWVFKFNPLYGSYSNYWTDPSGTKKRPVSFIVTSFLVPVTDDEVNVIVFLQISVQNKLLKLLTPMIKLVTMFITKYEIKADSDIARFAPVNATGGSHWRLTYLDKQIMANRKRMDSLYFARQPEPVLQD